MFSCCCANQSQIILKSFPVCGCALAKIACSQGCLEKEATAESTYYYELKVTIISH